MEDIFIPVLEASMIYATHYCKACGRSTVTAKDVEYGLKYAARTVLGNKIGTYFPEDNDESLDDEQSSEDSDESLDEDGSSDDIEVVDDSDEPFTRYTGTDDDTCVKMNEIIDTWDEWEPFSPAEKIVKNAIDSQQRNNHGGIFTN
jgi:hypothetical protein